jgi:hypothetical protein
MARNLAGEILLAFGFTVAVLTVTSWIFWLLSALVIGLTA